MLPEPHRTGRPRKRAMREIVNATCYVLRGGIARRLLPSVLPPWQTATAGFCAFAIARFSRRSITLSSWQIGSVLAARQSDGGYNHERVNEATSIAVEIAKKNNGSVPPFCRAAGSSTLLCMDQSKQTSREGLRGFNQLCRCFPLCRLPNAARQTIVSISMTFKSDSYTKLTI